MQNCWQHYNIILTELTIKIQILSNCVEKSGTEKDISQRNKQTTSI